MTQQQRNFNDSWSCATCSVPQRLGGWDGQPLNLPAVHQCEGDQILHQCLACHTRAKNDWITHMTFAGQLLFWQWQAEEEKEEEQDT